MFSFSVNMSVVIGNLYYFKRLYMYVKIICNLHGRIERGQSAQCFSQAIVCG